jgi:hypothetical protein
MNKIEATALLSIIKTAYPNFYKGAEEIDNAINLWSMMFADDSAKVVTEAVKALMCVLKFPPTIADVKTKIYDITHPEQMTEMEAWVIVKKAVENYSIYETYENNMKMFNSLPETIKNTIGNISQLRVWGQMDYESFNTVVQSNFMRSFKMKQQQEIEREMLPESTKNLIQQLSEGFSMGRLTDGRNK